MSWYLNEVEIQAPDKKSVDKSIQSVKHRTLDGGMARDLIGHEKLVISCSWDNISQAEWDKILAKYNAQRDSNDTINLVVSDLDFDAPVIIELGDLNYNLPNHYNYRSVSIIFYEI